MPIHWPHKLNFHHKIIENEIISTFFSPSCELLNKYSERAKEFTPSAVFGIQNGGEGKMAVKTSVVEPLPPPRPHVGDSASQFLAFLPTSSRIKEWRKWPDSMFFFWINSTADVHG